MKTRTLITYKVINPTDETIEFIHSDQINSIKEVKDKNNEKRILVSWYDDEFCIDSTFICEKLVEVERQIINEIL